jgi:hypothetical protein
MNENSRCPRHMRIEPNPGEIIAALPYLVGFPPVDAMIAVFFDDNGYLQMTARHDWDAITAAPRELAENLLTYARRCDCLSVALIAVGPTRDPATQESTLTEFAEYVQTRGNDTIAVLWGVHTESDRWWSPDCHRTCGRRTHTVPNHSDSHLVRRLQAEGREVAKTRHQIISEFEPASDSEVAVVASAVERLTPSSANPDESLALRISIVDRVELLLLADSVLRADDLATLAVACDDIPMRDAILRRFTEFASTNPKIWLQVWPRINESLATAPDSHVAAVAAVVGLFAWLKGDGIRAQAALDRALEHEPEHNLALLVRDAVSGGVPPSAWVAAMGDLTEADCLHTKGEDSRAA